MRSNLKKITQAVKGFKTNSIAGGFRAWSFDSTYRSQQRWQVQLYLLLSHDELGISRPGQS